MSNGNQESAVFGTELNLANVSVNSGAPSVTPDPSMPAEDVTPVATPVTASAVAPEQAKPTQTQYPSYGRNRWKGIDSPGAIAGLDYLVQHRRSKNGHPEEAFIPASGEDEFVAEIVLSRDDKTNGSQKPCLWEGGGAADRFGGGIVVADAQGRKCVPVFSFAASADYPNKRHSMIPVSEDSLIAMAAFDEGTALVLVMKCLELTFDRDRDAPVGRFALVEAYEGNPAMVEPIYQRRMDIELTETGDYRAMVSAAWTKANTYQCKHAIYTHPWKLWKSWIKPIRGQQIKPWEPQENCPEQVVLKLANVALGDPDPRSVYKDFSALIRDLEATARTTLGRLSYNGRGPKICVPFSVSKDGDNYRVSMQVYLSGTRTKDGQWVKNREPSIVKTFVYIAQSGDEAAVYLNTHKGLSWTNIEEALEGKPEGACYRVVYEYIGT